MVVLAWSDRAAARGHVEIARTAAKKQDPRGVRRPLAKPPALVARRAFLHVQASGRRFKGRLMLVLIAPHSRGGPSRVGYTVSRKVGKAVVRNQVRRRLKEIVRCNPSVLAAAFDYVVIAFPAAATVSFAALQQEALCLLKRARAWAAPRACLSL